MINYFKEIYLKSDLLIIYIKRLILF